MLSILVVSAGNGRPGAGLYNLARLQDIPVGDEEEFFLNERKRVIDYWKTHG